MIRVVLMAILGSFIVPVTATADIRVKQGELTAEARLDHARLEKMSQVVELTLIVEGPSPLEVTVPKPLLTTPNEWRVFELELPLREVLPNGRQRWQRRYQLSPLKLGDVALRPAPFTVRAGNLADAKLEWGEELLRVTVDTSVKNATVNSLRDPTAIEALPPTTATTAHERSWRMVLVPICLVLAAGLLLARRRKRGPPVVHDAAWALVELAIDPSADHCAWVIREYLGGRIGCDLRACTTAELMAKIPHEAPWTSEWRVAVQHVLEQCDAARFSGDHAESAVWQEPARAWIQQIEIAYQTRLTHVGEEVGRRE